MNIHFRQVNIDFSKPNVYIHSKNIEFSLINYRTELHKYLFAKPH